METLYDVCFSGELLEGQELQTVRQNLGKLFNADGETLDKLFCGKTQLLKRGCDKATAVKYQQAIERAGAKPIIRAHSGSTAKPDATAPEEEKAAAADSDFDLDLAPQGSDVLRPEERSVAVKNEVDTSFMELAATGVTLGESNEASGQAPDTSHLSMAEVGQDIPGLADTRTALSPNIDDISLSPAGTDFSDCAPEPAEPPPMDLTDIEMAPVGSDVLEERYKNKAEQPGPNTDHIALEDPDQ